MFVKSTGTKVEPTRITFYLHVFLSARIALKLENLCWINVQKENNRCVRFEKIIYEGGKVITTGIAMIIMNFQPRSQGIIQLFGSFFGP